MQHKQNYFSIILLFCASTGFSEEITREGLDDLMAECQRQRHENIAPIKAEAIEDCINIKSKDPEYCERYYRNYGEVTHVGHGRGMFWNLPVCEKAVEAEKYFKMYPSKHVYTFQ
jgi:hypothetical protein